MEADIVLRTHELQRLNTQRCSHMNYGVTIP
jgi:hypothetical protein